MSQRPDTAGAAGRTGAAPSFEERAAEVEARSGFYGEIKGVTAATDVDHGSRVDGGRSRARRRRRAARAAVRTARPRWTREVDVTDLEARRATLAGEARAQGLDAIPSLDVLVGQAALEALTRVPTAHGRERGGPAPARVALGLTVATDRGPAVVTVPAHDVAPTSRLAVAAAQLTTRCRDGAPLEQATSPAVTVDAVGVDDRVGAGTVLVIGAVRQRPWEHHGRTVPRRVCRFALEVDGTRVAAATAERYLDVVADLCERPAWLELHR